MKNMILWKETSFPETLHTCQQIDKTKEDLIRRRIQVKKRVENISILYSKVRKMKLCIIYGKG